MANNLGFPELTIGSKSYYVVDLQIYLNGINGSDFLKEDNIFGYKTLNAVLAYQKAKNMPATGKVDDGTWNAIYNDSMTGNQIKLTGFTHKVKPKVNLPGIDVTSTDLNNQPGNAANWTTIGLIAAAVLAVLYIVTQRK